MKNLSRLLVFILMVTTAIPVFAQTGLLADPAEVEIELKNGIGKNNRINVTVGDIEIVNVAGETGYNRHKMLGDDEKSWMDMSELRPIYAHYLQVQSNAISQGKMLRFVRSDDPLLRIQIVE